MTTAVSAVSAQPAVRAALVAQQRALINDALARVGGIVVEGRDIGSVVTPEAPLKVYLTASEEVRAARRGAQDRKAGRPGDPAAVLADVRRRDRLDSTRKTSPLHAAPDALVLDTDELSVDAVLDELLRLVEERGLVGELPESASPTRRRGCTTSPAGSAPGASGRSCGCGSTTGTGSRAAARSCLSPTTARSSTARCCSDYSGAARCSW